MNVLAVLALALGASSRSDHFLRSSEQMAHESRMNAPMQAPETTVMITRRTTIPAMIGLPATLCDRSQIPGNQTGQTAPETLIIRLSGIGQKVPVHRCSHPGSLDPMHLMIQGIWLIPTCLSLGYTMDNRA